ncbi:MAG: hypothetical protein R3F55_18095 [Alphaproteobacteria bacterium]
MADVTELLPDFPGFACQYDPNKNPFFRPIMVENLRKLKSVDLGRKLLDDIAGANPRQRGDFPPGVNVMAVPTEIHFVQSGHRLEAVYEEDHSRTVTGMSPSANPAYAPDGCPFWIDGGSSNAAVDTMAAGNGTGSVCFMRFHNAQVMTRKGEKADPYIVLGHELIHSLLALTGTTKDGRDEELWTTGLGAFADEPICENMLRKAFGLALRAKYF